MMKFQFDATQQYQLDAIAAIVDIFKGQQRKSVQYSVMLGGEDVGALPGIDQFGANLLGITEDEMKVNVREIQSRNQIADSESNGPLENWIIEDPVNEQLRACPHFTVEMETGTGKTYVYMRTIMELAKNYGYRKFVAVVPSVAVREGALKSIEQTKEHFLTLYNEPVEYFVYDSKNVNRLRQFATSNSIEIMVINIQAFVKGYKENPDAKSEDAGNVIYRESDKLSGKRPIDFVQVSRPIVIIDEPQSVDSTPKAQVAIKQLNPMCTLRYSATHRNRYNLMYVLDPIRAFQLKIVKEIVVSEVVGCDEGNTAFVRLEKTEAKNPIRAQVTISVSQTNGIKEKKIWLVKDDDLYDKSKNLPVYEKGFGIAEINANPEDPFIILTNGKKICQAEQIGGVREVIWDQQIDLTVKHHFEKLLRSKDANVKVISLFFIDKVAHYRSDPSDRSKLGKFGIAFEASFKKWAADPRFKKLPLAKLEASAVHEGYFSQDKSGFKDTKGETAADENTYNLIMRDKEKLLSQDEPLQFIFSHSALREGWDNPNVFQICTLNETSSLVKKRQEIGRGMRIPVNFEGERVFDETLNKLTVVVNESYENFVSALQTEYQEDAGVIFGQVSTQSLAYIIRNAEGGNPLIAPPEAKKLAQKIKSALQEAGVIDSSDMIKPSADQDVLFESVVMPDGLEELKSAIQDFCENAQIDRHIKRERNMVDNNLKVDVLNSKEFKALWEKISPRTTYVLEFVTETFIGEVIYRLKTMEPIRPPRVTVRTTEATVKSSGIVGHQIDGKTVEIDMSQHACQDIIAYLQNETDLTRDSLYKILLGSGRLKDFFVNPQVFLDQVASAIRGEMGRLAVEQGTLSRGLKGIKYSRLVMEGKPLRWDISEFAKSELVYVDSSVAVDKSIYERVVYDSNVEKKFALEIMQRPEVKLFVKLPWWYKIDTPVGKYNPDWAIALEDGEIVYVVRETKGTTDLDRLPFLTEKTKVLSGMAHYETLGVSYKVVTSAADVRAG